MSGPTNFASRGICNNNPGNIERTNIAWRGMASDQSSDARFVVFTDPIWGIRAIAKVMLSYQRIGADTVRQIINRWAPSTENDTGAYIALVARALDVGPDTSVDLSNPAILLSLTSAIIRHENGSQPYAIQTLADGIKQALPKIDAAA